MEAKTIQMVGFSVNDLKELITDCVKSEIEKVVNLTNQNKQEEKEILTRTEVCNLLKISFTTLWKYNNSKTLIAKKVRGRVFYLKSDVMNLLNKAA